MPVIEIIKTLLMLSFSFVICFPTFAQKISFSDISPLSVRVSSLSSGLVTNTHNLATLNYLLNEQSVITINLIAPAGLSYETQPDQSLLYDVNQQTGNFGRNASISANVSADFQLVLVSNTLIAGLAFTDINQTDLAYDALGATNHVCRNLTRLALESCFVSQDAIALGRINSNEVYVAKPLATLSASTWFGDDVTWGFHTSIDLNDRNDAVGDNYQWANAGASVQFDNSLVPELRVGYTKNLAGNELGYYSVGITFLKQAQIDLGWTGESETIDESNSPRSAYFSFAIETKF